MTLMEIIFEAKHAVSTYRNPDLTAFLAAVDPILAELNGYGIGSETVDYIDIYEEAVQISTSYTVKGCHDSDSYTIPMEIIEADNPLKAARLMKAKSKLDAARNAVMSASNVLTMAEQELAAAKAVYATLTKE